MLTLHVYVAAVLLFAHEGCSQKLGESCVIDHTKTLGVCAEGASCQSARRDYQINGTRPTLCNNSLLGILVCCSDNSSMLNTAPNNNNNNRRPVSSNSQQTTRNKRLSEKKCEEYKVFETVSFISLSKDPILTSITIPKCDYNGEELILRGSNALTGEFPHMAAIGWANFEGNYSFLCDGSLISKRFVLTAAHCSRHPNMKDPNPVIVRLGDQNLDPTKNDGANPIEVPIKSIRKHPQYKSPGKYHDIALLELASDIDFNEAIRPACLWNRPDFSEHTKALATSWGVVDLRTMRTSDELQRASLTLLENTFCNDILRNPRDQRWLDELTDNQLSAGELRGQKDACQVNTSRYYHSRDNSKMTIKVRNSVNVEVLFEMSQISRPLQCFGSPLGVKFRDNNCIFHLIGVKSFGDKCAQSGSPAVYTRVSSYLDWIESVVWPGES